MNGSIKRPIVAGILGLLAVGTAFGQPARTVVYAMDNDAGSNKVFAWSARSNGTLSLLGRFRTGGRGTGTMETPLAGPVDGIDPLGSQGSLTLGTNSRFLYAVNAGDGSVSVFRVLGNGGLLLWDKESTGSTSPVSVASHGRFVYVANVNDPGAGRPSTIVGFASRQNGTLAPIPGSRRLLSAPNARPSQISISPDGNSVIVTERETNVVSVFDINANGTLANPVVTPSPRPAPFGFDFVNSDTFVVSEAAPGDPAGSSASSYALAGGAATVISGGVLNGQMASCWVTSHPTGMWAYVSNTASNTVTNYAVSEKATLTISQMAVPTDGAGSAPIDADINSRGSLFFQLLGGKGTIAVYSVARNGDLALLGVRPTGLPMLGTQGLTVLR
jgi:6-phosphogluconolactonase